MPSVTATPSMMNAYLTDKNHMPKFLVAQRMIHDLLESSSLQHRELLLPGISLPKLKHKDWAEELRVDHKEHNECKGGNLLEDA